MLAVSSLSLHCANVGKTNSGDPGEETAVCRPLGPWPFLQTSGRQRVYPMLTAGSFSTMVSDVQEEVVPTDDRTAVGKIGTILRHGVGSSGLRMRWCELGSGYSDTYFKVHPQVMYDPTGLEQSSPAWPSPDILVIIAT